jgi:hypothetical protein
LNTLGCLASHTMIWQAGERRCDTPAKMAMRMKHHPSSDQQLSAVQTKLGEELRAQHDLMEPLAPRLLELVEQLDARFFERGAAEVRLYAELEEGIAALIHAAP